MGRELDFLNHASRRMVLDVTAVSREESAEPSEASRPREPLQSSDEIRAA